MVDSLLCALLLRHPTISFLVIIMVCNDVLINLPAYYLSPPLDNSSMRAEITLVLHSERWTTSKEGKEGGRYGRKEETEGQREGGRENRWILSLYTMRNSTESLKLGGGNINSKIHFLENKILVSILSAYFGFIFTYTLKIIICFSLKATIFFTDLFFQSKHEKHDSPEKSLKEIPSLRSSLCPHTKQTNTHTNKRCEG